MAKHSSLIRRQFLLKNSPLMRALSVVAGSFKAIGFTPTGQLIIPI